MPTGRGGWTRLQGAGCLWRLSVLRDKPGSSKNTGREAPYSWNRWLHTSQIQDRPAGAGRHP